MTSIMKKEDKKFTNMKISVSNNLLGAKCSTSKVILPQKRKAPSPKSLRNGRRRVARKTRQEERKNEMLLFDEVIKEEVNLIRGGGGGGGMSGLILVIYLIPMMKGSHPSLPRRQDAGSHPPLPRQ